MRIHKSKSGLSFAVSVLMFTLFVAVAVFASYGWAMDALKVNRERMTLDNLEVVMLSVDNSIREVAFKQNSTALVRYPVREASLTVNPQTDATLVTLNGLSNPGSATLLDEPLGQAKYGTLVDHTHLTGVEYLRGNTNLYANATESMTRIYENQTSAEVAIYLKYRVKVGYETVTEDSTTTHYIYVYAIKLTTPDGQARTFSNDLTLHTRSANVTISNDSYVAAGQLSLTVTEGQVNQQALTIPASNGDPVYVASTTATVRVE